MALSANMHTSDTKLVTAKAEIFANHDTALLSFSEACGGDEFRLYAPSRMHAVLLMIAEAFNAHMAEPANRATEAQPESVAAASIFEEVTPENGVIRLARWPEGYVLWHHGVIVWKSFSDLPPHDFWLPHSGIPDGGAMDADAALIMAACVAEPADTLGSVEDIMAKIPPSASDEAAAAVVERRDLPS